MPPRYYPAFCSTRRKSLIGRRVSARPRRVLLGPTGAPVGGSAPRTAGLSAPRPRSSGCQDETPIEIVLRNGRRLRLPPTVSLRVIAQVADAHAAGMQRENALGAFYRRIQARSGGAKAVVATARKLAERVYRMLRYGQEYVRQTEQAYEEAYQLRLVKSLAKKAAR